MPRKKKKDIDEVMSEFQRRTVLCDGRPLEDMPKSRQKWNAEKYFGLIGDLLDEMITHGYIQKPRVGFTNNTSKLSNEELVECRLDMVMQSVNSRELTDKEIIEEWGLNKAKKFLTPKEAINVGKISKELEGLFEDSGSSTEESEIGAAELKDLFE